MDRQIQWRSFWRLIFDVFNGQPRLLLEMTLWEDGAGTRLGRRLIDLTPQIVLDGTVSFTHDAMMLAPGCLKCTFTLGDIESDLLLEVGLDPNDPDVVAQKSVSLNGENIFIRADAALHWPSEGEHTLFYLSQPSAGGGPIPDEEFDATAPPGTFDAVRLAEAVVPAGRRKTVWEISGQHLESPRDFGLEAEEVRHGLRVHQDRHYTGDVYEFLADSLPLFSQAAMPTSHAFAAVENTVYIGGMPDPGDPSTCLMLHGEIAHLEFDPNNSCVSCAA